MADSVGIKKQGVIGVRVLLGLVKDPVLHKLTKTFSELRLC